MAYLKQSDIYASKPALVPEYNKTSASLMEIYACIRQVRNSNHGPYGLEVNEPVHRSIVPKKGVDRLFPSTHREEISLLKILALAEVASDVNFATCSVHWARNISPPCPQKQVRGACRNGYCYCGRKEDDGFRLKNEGENFQRFKDPLATSSQLLLL
jgi:hypothetical protein